MQYDDDDDGDRVGMGGGNPAMDERNAWIERRAEAMRRLDWINNGESFLRSSFPPQ